MFAKEEENEYWSKLTEELLTALSENKQDILAQKAEIWSTGYRQRVALALTEKLVQLEAGGRINLEHTKAKRLMDFFYETVIPEQFRAMAIYMLALSQEIQDPLFAYYHSLTAFQLYPKLGEFFGFQYVYN